MREQILKKDESLTEINFGLKIIQRKGGFSFGTDALLLAAFIRPRKYGTAADFGSGCGAISLLCAASGKFAHITAFEAQSEYADLCRRNAKLNCLDKIIETRNEDIRALESGKEKYSVIFTNPPYMRSDSGKQAADGGRNAARHELRGGIGDFCRAAAAALRWGGSFYAVYRPDRLVDLLSSMRESSIEPKRLCMVQRDDKHEPCLVLAEGIRGGGSSLKVMPTLMLSDTEGNVTDRTSLIYKSMEMYV